MIALLSLIIGLLLGYYGRQMYDMLKELYEDRKEQREAQKAGVIKPIGTKVTRHTPTDTETPTGSIKRMTPDQIFLDKHKETQQHDRNVQ